MISIFKFIKITVFVATIMAVNLSSTATASAPDVPIATGWTQADVKELTDYYADEYGVSRKVMQTIVEGESGYVYDLPGDGGASWGACQIHLPSHPNITKTQANDPHFCLDWMASEIKKGRARMWTVYRVCILGEAVYHKGKQIPCLVKK